MCAIWTYRNSYRFLNYMYWDRFLMFPVYAVWFMCMTMDGGIMSHNLFDNAVMLKFGKMSYALYVMHNPVWRWLRATATKDNFHPTYKYWIFGRGRLNYNQAPIAFFLAV